MKPWKQKLELDRKLEALDFETSLIGLLIWRAIWPAVSGAQGPYSSWSMYHIHVALLTLQGTWLCCLQDVHQVWEHRQIYIYIVVKDIISLQKNIIISLFPDYRMAINIYTCVVYMLGREASIPFHE